MTLVLGTKTSLFPYNAATSIIRSITQYVNSQALLEKAFALQCALPACSQRLLPIITEDSHNLLQSRPTRSPPSNRGNRDPCNRQGVGVVSLPVEIGL